MVIDRIAFPLFNSDAKLALFKDHFDSLPAEYQSLLDMDGFKWEYCCSFQTAVPLSDFRKYWDAGLIDNFVYYRQMGMVFISLLPAHHTDFMACLFNLHLMDQGIPPKHPVANGGLPLFWGSAFDSQDDFLAKGLGMFQSSSGKSIFRHQSFVLNAQERAVFGDLDIQSIKW